MRARRKKETHDTGNVFRRERNETCKFADLENDLPVVSARTFQVAPRFFEISRLRTDSRLYIKFFSITGNSPTVSPPLSLCSTLRVRVREKTLTKQIRAS